MAFNTSSTNSPDIVHKTVQPKGAYDRLYGRFVRFGRRGVLITLAIVFLLLALVVAVLQQVSNKKGGFVVPDLKQTVYTYAPTVILLFLTALWRQIDHSYKRAAPWIELRKGAAQAHQSVLLDYISTMQIVTFPASIRNGHVFVTLGILGFLVLKIVTIASTGLFVLQDSTVTTQQTVKLQRSYDGIFTSQNSHAPQNIAYTTYNTLTAGFSPQFGITAEAAYPTFELPKLDKTDSKFSISLDAVFPVVTCEPIRDIQAFITVTDRAARFWLNYTSSMCNATEPWPYSYIPVNESQPMPFRAILGNTVYSGCYNTTTGRNMESIDPVLMVVAEVLFEPGSNGNAKTIVNAAGALCRNSYTTGKVNVSGSTRDFPNNLVVQRLPDSNGPRLANLTNKAFHEFTAWALSSGPRIVGPDSLATHFQLIDLLSSTSQKIISRHGNGTAAAVFDSEALLAVAKATFMQAGVQVFDKYLRPNTTVDGSISIQSTRKILLVTAVSTWLMIGGFLISIAVAMYLMFSDARLYAKKGTETLLATAHLTIDSHSLTLLQLELSGRSEKYTKQYLQAYRFYTAFTDRRGQFGVVVQPAGEPKVTEPKNRFVVLRRWLKNTASTVESVRKQLRLRPKMPKQEPVYGWWKQITFSTWFLILMFVYSVAIISVLEVLQRLSDQRNGIAEVTTSSKLAQTVLARYLPAILVLLLATTYNCLEFNILLLNPYHHLRRTVKFHELQSSPPVTRFPAFSLWSAILRLDMAIIGASTAAFIGTLLTVVVSGLYTINYVSPNQEIMPSATGFFNTSKGVGGDGFAIHALDMIENMNVSWPVGTFDELALPIVALPADNTLPRLNESSMVQVQAYAYRPELTCDTLRPEDFTVIMAKDNATSGRQNASISARYSLLPDCQLADGYNNDSEMRFNYTFMILSRVNESYVAKLVDLYEGSGLASPSGTPGCPSVALIHGFMSKHDLNLVNAGNKYHTILPTDGPNPRTISVKVCYQGITRLNAKLTYRGPDLTLNQASRPEVDEKSAQKLVVPSTRSATAFSYHIQSQLDTLEVFNDTSNPFLGTRSEDLMTDKFFQAVLFGRTALPVEILKRAPHSQIDQDLLQKSIQSLYRRYMAQSLSADMRTPVANLQPSQLNAYSKDLSFSGTVIDSASGSQLRFIQHKTQKIILQSMIGYMILGGVLALWVMRDMRILIPSNRNPCTIWGSTGIWAGSRFCTERGSPTGRPAQITHETKDEVRIEQKSLIRQNVDNAATSEVEVASDDDRITSHEEDHGEVVEQLIQTEEKPVSTSTGSELRVRLAWWDVSDDVNLLGNRRLLQRYGIDVVD